MHSERGGRAVEESQLRSAVGSWGNWEKGLPGGKSQAVPSLVHLRPQEILIVASGAGTPEPLGSDIKSETSQGNQRFPRTVSPPKPGDGPIYTCSNPQALFPHSFTKLQLQVPAPRLGAAEFSPEALIM